MADFIECILNAFESNDIDYVHWKSNTNIDDALSGKDDLDILVDPSKKKKVYQLFQNYGIIRGYSNKDNWQHEIFHYFGLDIYKKKLVHIHIHFLLEVGYDVDKSINLPIIKEYLAKKDKYKYVYLPSKENEYILLIIRIILKNTLIPYSLLLPPAQLKLFLNQNKGIVKGGVYKEFIDLKHRVNRDDLKKALNITFPFINQKNFYMYEETILKNNSLKQYFKSGIRLKRELQNYSYHKAVKSFFLSLWRINKGRLDKLIKKQSKKIPEHGGKIFAFVGGDGAGKTSNINILNQVLSEHFYTETIHIGRPNLGFFSFILLVISKVLKIIKCTDLGKAFVYLSIANGRKEAFDKAKKFKKKGGIVLLDRIPLGGITSMDCPRIETISNNKYAWLSKIEKKLYSSIRDVDRLIVLKIDPKIALERRPEDEPNELLIRSGQIWDKDFSGIRNAYVINTNNEFDVVERRILKIVWKSLNEV